MNAHEATREASLIGGQVKILEGLYEILDTHVSMDLDVNSPEFDAGLAKLNDLEAKTQALIEKRDFLWSLA